MEGWFSTSSSPIEDKQKSGSSSLLADWNSYASSQQELQPSNSAISFDLESAVRSANNTVTGTFSVVSKSVRDIPGNLQSATSSVPSGKALLYFGLFLASGVFFIFIAFTLFLPVMVVMPQKFAICFTLGCGFIIGSFFALKGPKNQLSHMTSKEVSYQNFVSCCFQEAPIHTGVYMQHGWYHLCINGASQLHSLRCILCCTGSLTWILFYIIFSRWICWNEISDFCFNVQNNELFWEVIWFWLLFFYWEGKRVRSKLCL